MAPRPSLLLAAFPPELAGLERQPPPGWQVACTGLGALAAGIATARLLAALDPVQVLFLGTCGAYDARLAVGDPIQAGEALAVSLDELAGRAYRPEAERCRWSATLPSDRLPFPALTVAVPPAITRTLAGARRLVMGHHGRDLSTQMLFIETESLFAVAAIVPSCRAQIKEKTGSRSM